MLLNYLLVSCRSFSTLPLVRDLKARDLRFPDSFAGFHQCGRPPETWCEAGQEGSAAPVALEAHVWNVPENFLHGAVHS